MCSHLCPISSTHCMSWNCRPATAGSGSICCCWIVNWSVKLVCKNSVFSHHVPLLVKPHQIWAFPSLCTHLIKHDVEYLISFIVHVSLWHFERNKKMFITRPTPFLSTLHCPVNKGNHLRRKKKKSQICSPFLIWPCIQCPPGLYPSSPQSSLPLCYKEAYSILWNTPYIHTPHIQTPYIHKICSIH